MARLNTPHPPTAMPWPQVPGVNTIRQICVGRGSFIQTCFNGSSNLLRFATGERSKQRIALLNCYKWVSPAASQDEFKKLRSATL